MRCAVDDVSVKKTISAVVITRNRPDLLRQTLQSILTSQQKMEQVVVTDDSTNDETGKMLAAEFPAVVHLRGPRRGITANRNNGLRANRSDYVMLCDDDVLIDAAFSGAVMHRIHETGDALFFPAAREGNKVYLPNALDFMGYSTVRYETGVAQHTAHQQCFIVSRLITDSILYDENISTYGFEEFDFAYRVAAAGFPIIPMPEYVYQHMAPASDLSFQKGPDASRLYVTFKRHYYVDRKRLRALRFIAVAVPHHFVASFRRAGLRGLGIAWANVKLAGAMLRTYLRHREPDAAGEP
jgi:glycosyltransferase involved in cell wall biosynthesis